MNKEGFLDLLFAGAWISIFISTAITIILYGVMIKIFHNDNIVSVIVIAILSEAVSMYWTCRHLYMKHYGYKK